LLDHLNQPTTTLTETPVAVTPPPVEYCPPFTAILKKLRRSYLSFYLLALAIIALVAITMAYQFRPTMYLNFGGGYDAPYLDGWGDEVRPAQTQANDDEQTDSKAAPLDPTVGQRKFLPEPINKSYRWTKSRSIVLLPGAGAYPSQITLKAGGSPFYPGGQTLQILLNGKPFQQIELKPGVPQDYRFNFGAEWYQGGNLAVELRLTNLGAPARPFQDAIYQQSLLDATDSKGTINLDRADQLYKRELSQYSEGAKVYGLWLEAQTGVSGLVMPDLRVLLTLAMSAVLLFGILVYCGVSKNIAFGVGITLVAVFTLLIAVWRLEIALFATRLMLVMFLTALALPLLDWLMPRLFRHWQLQLPLKIFQILLVMFAIGMILRGGGVVYPQTIVIDEPYHIERINRVLNEPNGIMRLYNSKEDSKVPGHWSSQAIIPYSPFTYFYLAPIAALPLEREISVNLFMALLDAVRVFIIFGLAVVLGLGVKAGVIGAGLYLLMPLTWLLNSWGNWPTTFSLWMAVLYVFLALVYFQKLHRKRIWIGLTVLLTLTNLDYAVTMVFMGMLLGLWALSLIIFPGRKTPELRRSGWLILASTVTAGVAAVAIYYWQFIPDLAVTLTSFGSSFQEGEGLGLAPRTFFEYLGVYANNLFVRYGIGLYMLVALGAFVWLVINHRGYAYPTEPHRKRENFNYSSFILHPSSLVLMGAWLANFIFWGAAQWKIDMVDKHVWFITPLLVVMAGWAIIQLWENRQPPIARYTVQIIIIGTTLWLTYSAIAMWIYRIFFKRH
jgi:hypothetical protein